MTNMTKAEHKALLADLRHTVRYRGDTAKLAFRGRKVYLTITSRINALEWRDCVERRWTDAMMTSGCSSYATWRVGTLPEPPVDAGVVYQKAVDVARDKLDKAKAAYDKAFNVYIVELQAAGKAHQSTQGAI